VRVETLKEVAKPLVTTSRVEINDGYINLKISLSKNEVSLFEISEVMDESSTYIGLDDSKISIY